MEPLNYCRQMVKQFTRTLEIPSLPAQSRQILSHAIDLAAASQKFMLPDGGRLFDDKQFRALDDAEPLRLPYEMIALEYQQSGASAVDKESANWGDRSTKRIVFARQRADAIILMPVIWSDANGLWGPLPEVMIPLSGYLNRSAVTADGRVAIRVGSQNSVIPLTDYGDEVGAVLCFLNALQCSNVKSETIAPRGQGKKAKTALPFDAYHVLTIASTQARISDLGVRDGRSPREHLRRGHIRRYETGLKIWVNATVVNPGVGGKVRKDYLLGA